MNSNTSSEQKLSRNSIVLSSELRSWWVLTILKPIENFCLHYKISPNTITFCSTLMSIGALILFARGKILIAGWYIFFSASLDILDGRVARATGKVTKGGEFFDSVCDRYQDLFLFLGLFIYFRHSAWKYVVLLTLSGTFLVSYVRAKAESLGVDLQKIGAFQRPERVFMIGLGSILSSVVRITLMPFYGIGYDPPHHILHFVILVLAVGTNWTALERIRYSIRQLDHKN